MNESCATLHIFSGVHLGARIALSSGVWLLGSGDECDLIFEGLSAKHAKLTIEGEGANVTVCIEPVDGEVLYHDAPVLLKVDLAAGEAWYLGEMCCCWNLPHVEQEAIIPRIVARAQEESGEATTTAEEDVRIVQEQAEEAPAQQTEPELQTLDLPESMPPEKQKRRMSRPLALVLLALLLGLLSFSLSSGPTKEQYPEIVHKLLESHGYADLSARSRWNGVLVEGACAKRSNLEEIEQLVQELSFPVYLEVIVDEDLLRAVRNILTLKGLNPLLYMERTKEKTTLVIAAFMRDALVEKEAFLTLERDLTGLPERKTKIVYASDVAPVLEAALSAAGLSNVATSYLPGQIVLRTLEEANKKRLASVEAALSAQFGVPLFGEARVVEGAKAPTLRANALTLPVQEGEVASVEPKKAEDTSLGGLAITGVFTAPLTFISTADGRCLFVGAVLPNGTVLEGISPNALTLRRGNKVFTHSLRGMHE